MSARRRLDPNVGGGGSALGVARNKRGTPVYSHEDIREQYCINAKELHALEASRKKPMFGCLMSGPAQPSPCRRKSLLPACLRTRIPSEENIYGRSTGGILSSISPSHAKTTIDYEDESYFKRRPKTICYTDPKRLASLDDTLVEKLNARQKEVEAQSPKPSENLTKRPHELKLSSEYHSTDGLHTEKAESKIQRSAFTQPNTPDLPHSMKVRVSESAEANLDEKERQKHVSFQQKSISRSATVGALEEKSSPPKEDKEDTERAAKSPVTETKKTTERLLDGPRSPEYYEQKALDQLLAPVLTKALMQERIKRTCMRTQATQTDSAFVRKSLPHLALSPRSDKTEMVSQAAQTNGIEGRRRLVKSLSEAARYEGVDYEIYDLDGLPPPPPPPAKSIPQVLPLYPNEHALWAYPDYHTHSFHSLQNDESSESIKSDSISRCKCQSLRDSDEDILICSPTRAPRRSLTKTMSESEILTDKRKALSYASGYMDVDLSTHSGEEDIIEPLCVDECSYDLSHSRIFSQESLGEDTDEDVFHEHLLCSSMSQQPSAGGERRMSYPSENERKVFQSAATQSDENISQSLSYQQYQERNLKVNASPVESLTSDNTPVEEVSPIETSCLTDTYSSHEIGDHLEESVSESQVTVLQKLSFQTGTSSHLASDSENGSFHLTDPSSAATTPSAKHKNVAVGEAFDEELEEYENFKRNASAVNTLNLSPMSDDLTSISENVISESSQIAQSLNTSNELDRGVKSTVDNDFSTLPSTDSFKTRSKYDKGKKVLEKVAQSLKDENFASSMQARISEVRKLTSPESDSSSSHFTEQETSRSPASAGTNTITSRSDLSRTDSHTTTTDHSETSEDYITATENSLEVIENRRVLQPEERHVSSPPRLYYILEDETSTPKYFKTAPPDSVSAQHEVHEVSETSSIGVGPSSDFDTGQDLTSPDGDTTTSASYHIDNEESGSIISQVENFCISPNTSSSPKRQTKKNLDKDADNISLESYEIRDSIKASLRKASLDLSAVKAQMEISTQEIKTGAVKKRYSTGKISKEDSRRYSKYLDDSEMDVGNIRRHSLNEDEREKLKSVLKLNFPPGTTMYGSSTGWEEEASTDPQINEKSTDGRSKKAVTIQSNPKEQNTQPTETNDKEKVSEAPPWNEKVKRQTEELSTPGMVRSPAMHEGFRLEDWTPVRTPGTPEGGVDADTSDDSYEEKIKLKNAKIDKIFRERSKTPCVLKEEKSKKRDSAFTQYERRREAHKKHSTEIVANSDNVYSSSHETLRSSPHLEKIPMEPKYIDTSSHPIPKSSIIYPGDMRRRSGDMSVGFWNRNLEENLRVNGHLLGPSDNLKKAESLRSFSPGSDNVFLSASHEQLDGSRTHLCSQCGERSISREDMLKSSPHHHLSSYDRKAYERDLRIRPVSSRARSEERSNFPKELGMSSFSLELGDAPIRNDGDDDEIGVYHESYCSSPWLYVSPTDELLAWRRDALPPPFIPPHVRIPGFSYPESVEGDYDGVEDDDTDSIRRSRASSPESTCSEKDFKTRYQAITHRMIHRKASVEMYRRILCGTFQTDKTVYVMRGSGEFGFRIHGSRPVVVSAIESATPAETSGLEVGDIVMSINDINVLDASHSDVVRLAHSGSDTLRLDVARTCDVLTPLVTNDPTPVCAGYLYKLGGAHHMPGSNVITRKWRRRWFALKKDRCLYYYKSEMDQTPLGAVHLLDYSVHALSDGGRPYAFTIAKFRGTTLHLAARTEDARNRWGQMVTQAALEASQRDDLIEESARRVQQSPGAITTPDCFGYLSKLGSRWHQWKRRYCVLKDACLFFYYDTDATSAIGVVHLHGYRVQSTSIAGKKFAFELIPPDPRYRHFYLHTDSDSDKKRWMAGFEYSIDRWIKAG